MSLRRRPSAFRQNWKFMGAITLVSGIIAIGIALATQGLEGMMRKASLAFKAMDNPSQLNAEEKGELKKMIKDKSSAKKQFEGLSPEQKERAKQQFNQLDEAE